MKIWLNVFLLFLLAVLSSCNGGSDKEYDRLNVVLAHQNEYLQQKRQRLESLRQTLGKAKDDNEKYLLNDQLYDEYMAFKYDSALHYVDNTITLSQKMHDKHREGLALLHKTHIMAVGGLFDEAAQLLSSVDTTALTHEELADYYDLRVELEIYNAEYYTGTEYAVVHQKNMVELRKKIISMTSEGTQKHLIAQATNLSEEKRDGEAIELLKSYLIHSKLASGNREYSIVTNIIGYFYTHKNNLKEAEHYFVESAISDIKGCIFENTSKRAIADLLFDKGEIDQAYQILNLSIEDANFYGTRLRNVQAASLTPKIVNAYQMKHDSTRRWTIIAMISISLLAVLMIVAVIVAVTMMRRYRRVNEKIKLINGQLEETVSKLKIVNLQLKETGKVKEEYLTRFFKLCSSFLDIQDTNTKKVARMLRDRKYSELSQMLKGTSITDEMLHQFNQHFDEAFLNIYPDFVDELNSLLQPDEQIVKKANGRLSTDIRILALVRLGITDNNSIASILRTSITTIYTYRSKFKARAINKDSFESDLCAIGTSD